MEHLLWTERHRPRTVEDCILPERLKAVFQEYVNQKEIPNLLLAGGAGVGKTTIAKAMCNEVGCDYMVINSKDGLNYLKTVLFHIESGEMIDSETLIPYVQLKGMNDYQSFGSGVTYFRRYCLSSILGLVTDKDTDASGEQIKPKKPKIDNDRLMKAIAAVKSGKYELADIPLNFDLTLEHLMPVLQT